MYIHGSAVQLIMYTVASACSFACHGTTNRGDVFLQKTGSGGINNGVIASKYKYYCMVRHAYLQWE